MNKIIAVLGILIVIMLGCLFFCAGFFIATTSTSSSTNQKTDGKIESGKSITENDVDAVMDAKSSSTSDKIKDLLSSAIDTASTSVNHVADDFKDKMDDAKSSDENLQLSVDSLLKEIAASHTVDDGCSSVKTHEQVSVKKEDNPRSLRGKKVVFIGYFKNNIAIQVQKILETKGYRTHLERSKTGDENESFLFCGPFKKDLNARKLLIWLHQHDFSEARQINITNGAMEETLYDFATEGSSMPTNEEKDIPELKPMQAAAQPTAIPVAQTIVKQNPIATSNPHLSPPTAPVTNPR